MSRADSEPEWDVYTGLLFVSSSALLIGCLLLILELQKYDWSITG